MALRKVFISAGHTNVKGMDRGAEGNGFVEGDLTHSLRDLIIKYLNDVYNIKAEADANNTILEKTLSWLRQKTTARCILLDIHFNAATPAAEGVECFVPQKYTEFELGLAEALVSAVVKQTAFKKRGNLAGKAGVKDESQSARKRLGWMSVVGENVLLEVCFITNKQEMEVYKLQEKQIAREIAKALHDWSKK